MTDHMPFQYQNFARRFDTATIAISPRTFTLQGFYAAYRASWRNAHAERDYRVMG